MSLTRLKEILTTTPGRWATLLLAFALALGVVVVSPGQRITVLEVRVSSLTIQRVADSIRQDSISAKLYPLNIRQCIDFEHQPEYLALMQLTQFCRENFHRNPLR